MFLFPDNDKPITIWDRCNALREVSAGIAGALPMKLKISEIKAACEVFGATQEEFEGVLIVEQTAFPFILEQFKKK